MLVRQVYKTLIVIFVVAVCFVFAYIKDANASYGSLGGKLEGRAWLMKSVVLKKKIINGAETVVVEFNNRDLSDEEICKDNRMDAHKLLVQIPLNTQNGLKIPDVENANIRMNGNNDMNVMNCFYQIGLNTAELNSNQVFVSGSLQLVSERTHTDLSGIFKARVCN